VSRLADPNGDVGQVTSAAFELHLRDHTFPGGDFMAVAIEVLDLAGIDRADPIAYETLLADHLPEIEFGGKQHRKIRFAVLATAARRGGLEPDLLDEIIYWNDDFWRYALYAAIALIRAAAANTGQSVPELARRLTNGQTPPDPITGRHGS
jgi:hypothetical protein